MGLSGGDHTRETDKDCNVCGSVVEIVNHAASQCSDHTCLTRERSNDISTDSTASEVQDYYLERLKEMRDGCVRIDDIDDAVEDAYDTFKAAGRNETASSKRASVDALLPFSSYDGWGDLKMAMGDA